MASPPHIGRRAHNRQPFFSTTADYQTDLEWLSDAARRTGRQIHAYVLTINHVPLQLTPSDAQAVSI